MRGSELVAGSLIAEIRRVSGLSQAELAKRASLAAPVLSAYEHGRRQPSVAALARVAQAAGLEVRLFPASGRAADEHAGRILSDVLDLADLMPYRPRRELSYPPLIRFAS